MSCILALPEVHVHMMVGEVSGLQNLPRSIFQSRLQIPQPSYAHAPVPVLVYMTYMPWHGGLAAVYAHMKIGEPEPGFENAFGMLFLAGAGSRAWCLVLGAFTFTDGYLAPSRVCLFCDAC
jgi:hypothetical protein